VVARNQGRFIAMPGVIAADAMVPTQFHHQPPGTIYELGSARDAVMQDAAQRISDAGGAMLVVDYGYSGPKTGDTFQAVKDHEFADPFAGPGQADLTAHVDFTTLANAARTAGVRSYGPVAQGAWLMQLGIEARAEALAAQNPKDRAAIQIAKARLTGADQMGRLFQVLGASHPEWPRPEGFA
jgi:NADH dehydrogenase [ubiquinone] 1 alpha subcomplex assembly factor 7